MLVAWGPPPDSGPNRVLAIRKTLREIESLHGIYPAGVRIYDSPAHSCPDESGCEGCHAESLILEELYDPIEAIRLQPGAH